MGPRIVTVTEEAEGLILACLGHVPILATPTATFAAIWTWASGCQVPRRPATVASKDLGLFTNTTVDPPNPDPTQLNSFRSQLGRQGDTAVWVPAKAFRRDLTASGPNLAASRWVRRASQISFLRCDLVKIFDLNRCHWRTSGRSPQLTDDVVQPLAKLAGVDFTTVMFRTPSWVSCSSISPLVLRQTLLTLPTESCSDGSDRRSFRISEYDFGSFAFTTTTSWRGRLCAFTLGFGSGALAFGVACFLPFFFFFLWTCCQSSSAGLEAFAASFCPLVIVLGAGVGGLLPLPPEARGTRDFPFTRGPGDVCTSFSSVFWRGRCSSPSRAV
ncbi:unnamed protein product [Trichogramma brassicae]|uniref:Uncharacterized protein n=1 Tax=Trichogramma brassicae TaxID=86971 RepID=A0A6H5IUL9_9HYME|nr:unnamed protein product [Trichogramma brassicae]